MQNPSKRPPQIDSKTPGLIKRLLLLLAHQAGLEVSINELATQLQMARLKFERIGKGSQVMIPKNEGLVGDTGFEPVTSTV